ncbi:hypothetical protein [Salinivirga cyanobacteriivorans]
MKRVKFFIIALSTIAFFSCERQENDDLNNGSLLSDDEKAAITNDAAADDVTEALDYEVDYFTSSSEVIFEIEDDTQLKSTNRWGLRYLDGEGPVITIDPAGNVWPKTITIDYGDGVDLINGRTISGIITIEVSDRPLTNGATRHVTYTNFYVDSVNIAGAATRTFTGTDSTERVFSNVSDLTLTFTDESQLFRHGERTRTLAEGFETIFDHTDDLILITGFVNYENTDSATFSKTITSPLTKIGGCRFIVEGTVFFSLNGEEFAELDYGDGTCDDIATITKNGETHQITIGHRYRRFPWWRR